MKKKILLTVALVVVLAVVAIAVFAQGAGNAGQGRPGRPGGNGQGGPGGAGQGQPNIGQMFTQMDANGDGKLTKEEVPEQMWERIVKADADNDGAITQEEFTKSFAARAGQGQDSIEQMFAQLDANKDDKLTEEEIVAQAWTSIAKADANADGVITKEELTKLFANRAQGQQNVDQMFTQMDKNTDGKLTEDEVPEQAWTRIAKADADADGAVTKEELTKSFANRAQGQQNVDQMFTQLDKNTDGKLTEDEVPEQAWTRVAKADANDDGVVTKEELTKSFANRAQGQQNVDQMFTQLDGDKDGKLVEDEVIEQSLTRITEADANNDGVVTKEEFIQSFGGGQGRTGQGQTEMGQRNPGQMFERLDANKDGKLTKDEVPEQAWTRLSEADEDGDGAITQEELTKAFANRPARPNGEGRGGRGGNRNGGGQGTDI